MLAGLSSRQPCIRLRSGASLSVLPFPRMDPARHGGRAPLGLADIRRCEEVALEAQPDPLPTTDGPGTGDLRVILG